MQSGCQATAHVFCSWAAARFQHHSSVPKLSSKSVSNPTPLFPAPHLQQAWVGALLERRVQRLLLLQRHLERVALLTQLVALLVQALTETQREQAAGGTL